MYMWRLLYIYIHHPYPRSPLYRTLNGTTLKGPPPPWYINSGACFLLKCLRLSWVWPAALTRFVFYVKNDVFTLF